MTISANSNLNSLFKRNFYKINNLIFFFFYNIKLVKISKCYYVFFNKLSLCIYILCRYNLNEKKHKNVFLFFFSLKKRFSLKKNLFKKDLVPKFFVFFKWSSIHILQNIRLYMKKMKFISFFSKSIITKNLKIFFQLYWFNIYTVLSKNFIMLILKNLFFKYVFRDSFLYTKINLNFFETKQLDYITSSLLSQYIVRNVKQGHQLNRIIFPIIKNLSKLKIHFNGWKIGCSGRFKRRGRAQRVWYGRQSVPLSTLFVNIDYAEQVVRLRNGICCIKVFLTKRSKYLYNI